MVGGDIPEVLVRGSGTPVTVFAHGLGGSIADTRPLASGVGGTNVFYTGAAHDGVAVDDFGYALLARQLRAVADDHGATRALGISMGAGALCRLLAETPDRFEKVVFFLPAVLSVPRGRTAISSLAKLDAAAESGDAAAVAAVINADLPEAVRGTPAALAYATARAKTLCLPSMRRVPAALAADVAVGDESLLRRVTARALVLGCEDDAAHPAPIARRLAELLPNAEAHIYDQPDVVWTQRADLRRRISGFLSD